MTGIEDGKRMEYMIACANDTMWRASGVPAVRVRRGNTEAKVIYISFVCFP